MKVVFVVLEDSDVVAIFPEEKERNGLLTCYAHIGQHGSAAPECLRAREATLSEGVSLLAELRGIYESAEDFVPLEVISIEDARAIVGWEA